MSIVLMKYITKRNTKYIILKIFTMNNNILIKNYYEKNDYDGNLLSSIIYLDEKKRTQ